MPDADHQTQILNGAPWIYKEMTSPLNIQGTCDENATLPLTCKLPSCSNSRRMDMRRVVLPQATGPTTAISSPFFTLRFRPGVFVLIYHLVIEWWINWTEIQNVWKINFIVYSWSWTIGFLVNVCGVTLTFRHHILWSVQTTTPYEYETLCWIK